MEPINLWNVYRIFDMATQIDVKEVLKQRGDRYGSYNKVAFTSQHLKATLRNGNAWQDRKLSPSQCESLELICNKLSRIVNGDPNYLDSWVDIIGYVQLIVNEIDNHEKI